MYHIIQYIKHLLTATDQHGVHSPFVFKYITQCLYAKKRYSKKKSTNILLKSISYFSPEKLKIIPKDIVLEKQIQKKLNLTPSEDSPVDIIYLSHPIADILSVHIEKMHNESMIIIGDIHRKKAYSAIWKTLKQDKLITVSIDMLYCGILFVRREQAKEHFKIRI